MAPVDLDGNVQGFKIAGISAIQDKPLNMNLEPMRSIPKP